MPGAKNRRRQPKLPSPVAFYVGGKCLPCNFKHGFDAALAVCRANVAFVRFLHHKHGKTLRVKHTGAAGGTLVQRIVFFFVVGLGFFHILQRYLKQLAAL